MGGCYHSVLKETGSEGMNCIRLSVGRYQTAVCRRLGVKLCTVLDWPGTESRPQCALDWV